ncbi:E3 ubiquitin-protein ligase WAV3-like [Rhododendron vialii]|uniref:E3 ubiquitin-protein ligase WAV3-like n=1 Tax=Rhododendron vialii TaxID=182163 RepID=UPI00265F9A50|nr:E3 ubiquitin-protein ligase WAV3-like [Rhododendron vialii]
MVHGWRRVFCTSVSKDSDSKDPNRNREKQEEQTTTPRFGSRFRFFSNPSTPRLHTQSAPSPTTLRCRTTATTLPTPPDSPKLQCKTAKNSPRFFFSRSSTPSSPRSPSTLSLLKSTLRISRVKCGICLQSVKTGQGRAIFTAECSHGFHFPCIASLLKNHQGGGALVCPVCGCNWKELPILTSHQNNSQLNKPDLQEKNQESAVVDARTNSNSNNNERKQQSTRPDSNLKVYNDDEPLMSPKSATRFYPIPESDENEEDINEAGNDSENIGAEEFRGFFVNPIASSPVKQRPGIVEVVLSPDAAVVSVGRSHETYAAVLKVRAPPRNARQRVPIDLVAVLDVGGRMSAEKVHVLKRAMRLVVSSLSSTDRLSIVAFATTSKRLLPLRRMTANGRVSARRIVDAIVSTQGETIASSASDAVKKAAKVLEDRRERNPVASILVLSESHNERTSTSVKSITTRFAHLEIPVHSVEFGQGSSGAYNHAPSDDAFAKCVDGLLSVVVQDLRLQLGFLSGSSPGEISAVYSMSSRPSSIEPGSIRIGDLYGEEEREFLMELKVPSSSNRAHHILSVRCCHKDPSTQELVYSRDLPLLVPRPHSVRSSSTPPSIERLRSLFFTTRAVAESRLLIERNNYTAAHHMLTSARALLVQSRSASADEFIRALDGELTELQWRRQKLTATQTEVEVQRRRGNVTEREAAVFLDEKGEPLTPTSAWRAAERLAKVAIMRKSVNRVSDLHGFENARF